MTLRVLGYPKLWHALEKKSHSLQLTQFKFIYFLHGIFSDTHLSDKYVKEVWLKSLEKWYPTLHGWDVPQ